MKKQKLLKFIICLVLCITVLTVNIHQNTYAVAGVDDILIMTIAGMLLAAAGVAVTDPNNQESLSGESGRFFSSVKSVNDFVEEHFYDQKTAVQNWLIVQAAKYVDEQQHDTIQVWNSKTSTMQDIEVVNVGIDDSLLTDIGTNEWLTNFIDNDVTYQDFTMKYNVVPVTGHQQWTTYPQSPVPGYTYQFIIRYGATPYLMLSTQPWYRDGSNNYDNAAVPVNYLYCQYISGTNEWGVMDTVLSTAGSHSVAGTGTLLQANYNIFTDNTYQTVLFAKTTTGGGTLDSTITRTKTLEQVKRDVALPSSMYIPVQQDVMNQIAEGELDAMDVMTNNGETTADIPITSVITVQNPGMTDSDRTWWQQIIGGITTGITASTAAITAAVTATTDAVSQAYENIMPKFQEFKIFDLIFIWLDILISCIALVIRACLFLATIVAITPSGTLLNADAVSGLDFFKNQTIPVIGVSVWNMFSGMMTLVISLSIVKKVRNTHS